MIEHNGELVVGGTFARAGGVSANAIAKWNGSSWSTVGDAQGRIIGTVHALDVWRNRLYIAGGFFFDAPGSPITNIAQLFGSSWSAVGQGIPTGTVYCLQAHGSSLAAGGSFTGIGQGVPGSLGLWDGNEWSAPEGGVGGGAAQVTGGTGSAAAVCELLSRSGELVLGGTFTAAGAVSVGSIARWVGAPVLTDDGPALVTIAPGGEIVIPVLAGGVGPLLYQWERDGQFLSDGATTVGSIVSGSEGPLLTISDFTPDDAGVYSCTVTNLCGFASTAGTVVSVGSACDGIDFNNDGVAPDVLDLQDFTLVYGGGACSNDPNCNDIDFNNDGVFPDERDLFDFVRVFSGDGC
jgi:hypothetical protein